MKPDLMPVRAKEEIAFKCRCCAACCRNVDGQIMVEPSDAYRLGRYLAKQKGDVSTIEDVYEKYAHSSMLTEGYPIFLLNTCGDDHSCVFLKDGRCSVYDARPRVCRLYPFSALPGKDGKRFAFYKCLDRHASHFFGGKTRIHEWMHQNLTKEDKAFLEAEKDVLTEIGRLLQGLDSDGQFDCLFLFLFYRYYNYRLNRPFMEQYKSNQEALMKELRRRVRKRA